MWKRTPKGKGDQLFQVRREDSPITCGPLPVDKEDKQDLLEWGRWVLTCARETGKPLSEEGKRCYSFQARGEKKRGRRGVKSKKSTCSIRRKEKKEKQGPFSEGRIVFELQQKNGGLKGRFGEKNRALIQRSVRGGKVPIMRETKSEIAMIGEGNIIDPVRDSKQERKNAVGIIIRTAVPGKKGSN